MNRRDFLYGLGGGAAALSLSASSVNSSQLAASSAILPTPAQSGIDHIVVVTMENRSFDHFLGWLPGADGKQAGLSFKDATGASYATHELASDYEGCGFSDPDHSYTGSRTAYNNGAMDGFLRAGKNDHFSIGYYSQGDLPFFTALAQNYLVCQRYFASILSATFPNRMFMWSAQTDRLGDTVQLTGMPTIFDRLSKAGISHKYYFNNVPFLALWGLKYIFSTSLFSDFLSNASAGTLPAVSFVDPVYTVLDDGTGNDDHPHADVRNGDAFLAKIYHALSQSPAWSKTVLIIMFDEWGGFFEHVAPPRATAPNNIDTDLVGGKALLGFRLPVIVVSPFTRNTSATPLLSSTVFDHTSILKLIEWRFGLSPLTARDASSDVGNLATALNFATPSTSLPNVPTTSSILAKPCLFNIIAAQTAGPSTAAAGAALTEWQMLANEPATQAWGQNPSFAGKIAKPAR